MDTGSVERSRFGKAQIMNKAPAIGIVALGLIVMKNRRLVLGKLESTVPLTVLTQTALDHAKTFLQTLPEEVRGPLIAAVYLSLPMSIVGAIGGLGWATFGSVRARIGLFFEKHCKVSLTFSNSDKHYDVVVDYIGTRCSVETGKILASTKPREKPSFNEMLAGWLGGKMKAPTLYYQPDIQSFSNYFDWTDEEGRVHRIWLQKIVEKPQLRSDSNKQVDPETLTLTIWWTTDPQPLKNFMSAALKTMLADVGQGRVDIYVKHMWLPMWTKAVSKDRRDRDTIVLDENLADNIVQDLRHFFEKKTADWYNNAGIPYRRGYLLYGPPGCGKTSFAQVLAGELGLDVCLMNLSNKDMNDDDLAELLRAAQPRSMMLLEDVDAIFVERQAGKDKQGGVSFSGLLNALDGAAAQEGCVIVLTTNHKDRLDEALIRPGRCDVHVHIQKASQDQARRMFIRFFASESLVRATDSSGAIFTAAPHSFQTGDGVHCKVGKASMPLRLNSEPASEQKTYYARASATERSNQRQLWLYDTSANASAGGSAGLLKSDAGKHTKLQTIPDGARRFGSRIPEKQVSMAKLQGYLMKQKLEAEQHFKSLRDNGDLPAALTDPNASDEEQQCLYGTAVNHFASEGAIMNVHELLDVKYEAEEVSIPIYDHLRRLGLHRFAPFFEHYGIREKKHLRSDIKERMESWDPDLKMGPQRDRLVALIDGDKSIDDAYSLADLSILRDRFIAAFQSSAAKVSSDVSTSQPPLLRSPNNDSPTIAPPRLQLLRQSSNRSTVSVECEEAKLTLLDMAHQFQEALEDNGKTHVSMWQLEMHLRRFAEDPREALKNCNDLLRSDKARSWSERSISPATTFGFLRRIGLEEYAYTLEDKGHKFWSDFKHMSVDDLKKEDMKEVDAKFCHAVLQASKDRPDLLRQFQLPDFDDLQSALRIRFPECSAADARRFALNLTDETGSTYASCLQVGRYLKDASSVADAIENVATGLKVLSAAEAARVRPEAPPAPEESKDWVHLWLKGAGLEQHSQAFLGQALSTKDDVLAAPLDNGALERAGITKMGERAKILRMLAKEKSDQSEKSQDVPKTTDVAGSKTNEQSEKKEDNPKTDTPRGKKSKNGTKSDTK